MDMTIGIGILVCVATLVAGGYYASGFDSAGRSLRERLERLEDPERLYRERVDALKMLPTRELRAMDRTYRHATGLVGCPRHEEIRQARKELIWARLDERGAARRLRHDINEALAGLELRSLDLTMLRQLDGVLRKRRP